MSEKKKLETYDDPNRFAPPARYELYEHSAACYGYQNFVVTRDSLAVLPEDPKLQIKHEYLSPLLSPRFVEGKTVLDLGGNAAYFSYLSLLNGADEATCLDMDDDYLNMAAAVKKGLGFRDLNVVKGDVAEWYKPVDVTIALAIVHWIYSCTAVMGSLDAIFKKFSEITRSMLIVEWVDPADPAIQFFKHLDWNKDQVQGPYTREAFEDGLRKHFKSFGMIGQVGQTRVLYAAFNAENNLDTTGPLKPALPLDKAIRLRNLCEHDGIQFWSYVFDVDNVIYKQATLDLASREGKIIALLADSAEYFPKVLDAVDQDGSSIVAFEKFKGDDLYKASGSIMKDRQSFFTFAWHCLNILEALADAGVKHRDIRIDNMLFVEGRPVLYDFGWATAPGLDYFSPQFLGADGRPPDGTFCDVYSVGLVLARLNNNRYNEFNSALQLMIDPEPHLRITDVKALKALFAAAYDSSTNNKG